MLLIKTIRYSFVICLLMWSFGPQVVVAITAKDKYFKAEAAYRALQKNAKNQKYRDNWLNCIDKFKSVYRHDPSGPWAPAGLYQTGNLYRGLYRWSHKLEDIEQAKDHYERIIKRFPQSAYRTKAESVIKIINKELSASKRIKNKKNTNRDIGTKTDTIGSLIQQTQRASLAPRPNPIKKSGQKTKITGLRYWSNPSYTRIVIDADNETTFSHNLLKKDPSIHKPQRLYVDLDHSWLGEKTQKTVPIDDNLLSNARAGQYNRETVRVVVDIKSFTRYNIFSLKSPFRIVIDVWGKSDGKKSFRRSTAITRRSKLPKKGSLAKQLALGVRRVVIDPGHGGSDYGAPGYLRGVHEKHVTLKISKLLAKKIKQQLGLEVILTRTTDRHLTLEERTAIANTQNADLFISIHTNSHRDRRAYGMETYILNFATDDEAVRVAARENATSQKNISDLQKILFDLMSHAKINESSRLAGFVHNSMYRNIKKRYSRTKSKGVKQAPFYVLLGAEMPAILIETSFISNPRECKRLVNSKYQNHLCDGIITGIRTYIKETNPSAMVRSRPAKGTSG